MLDLLKKRDRKPPESQLKRTYQNDLRAIGRYADDAGFSNLGIYEVNDGFIVRSYDDATPDVIEAVEVPESDLRDLILKNFTARGRSTDEAKRKLCPTGYEDFLRALGHELEASHGKALSIQEMETCIAVSFMELRSVNEGYVWQAVEWLLRPDRIQDMLDAAFLRRGRENSN